MVVEVHELELTQKLRRNRSGEDRKLEGRRSVAAQRDERVGRLRHQRHRGSWEYRLGQHDVKELLDPE